MKRIVRLLSNEFTPVCSMYLGKKGKSVEVEQKRAKRFCSYDEAVAYLVEIDPRCVRKVYRDRKYKIVKLVTRSEVRAQTIASVLRKLEAHQIEARRFNPEYRKALSNVRAMVQRMAA